MKLSLLFFVLFFCLHSISQTKPKKNSEKMPTQQEMNDMMKEMQKAMDDMSPEDKKMMDSMGFKMPDMKNMQQMASFASIGEVNVGPKEPSVSIGGVNAIISINSGFTAGGSGILKGVKL